MAGDADAIIGIYRRHAAAWSRARGTSLDEKPWIDRFGSLLPALGNVLDLGCGSGEPIATYLHRQGFWIVGADSAPEMIAVFRSNLPEERAIVHDMRNLRLNETFSGILAWDSFFHLPREDQRAMFKLFREHSEPLTALMFTSGDEEGEAIGEFANEPLYHASLDASEYRHLLGESGFFVVAHLAEDERCGGRTIWLAQRM